MKQQALKYYLDHDYSVIPLGLDKRPAIKSWLKHQTERADENQINAWWDANPKANIGIVTGKISGITVVDIDNKGDVSTPLDTFPSTYTVRTPSGGYHLYYKYDETIKQTANTYPQFPHVDIRNDGGYVVAGGSTTNYGDGEGGLYKVEKDIPVVEFPTELFNPQGEKQKKKKKVSDLVGRPSGDRNASMASFIGKLLLTTPQAKWDKEIWPAVMQANATYKPPLDQAELLSVYESICSAEIKRLAKESNPDSNDEEGEILKKFIQGATNGTYALAEYIVKKYNIITIGESEREVYVYQNGVYKRAENEIIFPEVQRVLKNRVTKSAKSETFHKVADATAKPRDIFSSAPVNLIPLKNGVYNLETKELLPHSPDYKFTFQFPIIYDPKADCPEVKKFLKDILSDDQIATVQEWIGYYFYRLYMFKKAIIFVGEGDTGKTTLLETIISLIGKENTASISLHKMVGDKFSGAQMYQKHGNICDELSAIDVSDTGIFKTATGGGTLSGEYKFGNQFSFLNYAKLTFACNKIPDVKDFDDEAYFNRWMVIRFSKTIEKKIPNFVARLTTEAERSGLFNFAMEGLARLLENGRFSYANTAIDTKMEMMKSGSSIAQFASQMVEQEAGAEITKEKMYEAYSDFCVENELPIDSIKLFGTRFQFYVPYASEGHLTIAKGYGKTERVRGWRNVALKKTEESIKSEVMAQEELESLAKMSHEG